MPPEPPKIMEQPRLLATVRSSDPGLTSPALMFRTLQGAGAVHLNGQEHGASGCSWSVSRSTAFDPKIPLPSWPPQDAAFLGRWTRLDEQGRAASTLEAWIAGGGFRPEEMKRLRETHAHVVEGEHVLYVRADLGGAVRTGAVRVLVAGYGYTPFTPHTGGEREHMRGLEPTICFDRLAAR